MSAGSLTLGRCGALRSPRQMGVTGADGSVTVTAQADASTDAAYQALLFQYAGYPHPDEPYVPIITTGRLVGLTGLYSDVTVDIARGVGDGEAAYKATVTITGRRVPSFAAPLAQLSHFGFLRSNTVSFTSASETYGVGLPNAIWEVSGVPASGTWSTVPGEGGSARLWYKQTSGVDFDVLYGVAPGDWYDFAAKVEAKLGGGSDWVTVPGLHTENLPESIRVGNHAARVSMAVDASGYLNIVTEHHDGTQWETAKRWWLIGSTFGQALGVDAATIIANTPAYCIVRWVVETTAGPTAGQVMIDAKVRRGIRNIEFTVKGTASDTWQVLRSTVEAGQAIPGGVPAGVRANANDGDGNRYLLMTPEAYTHDLTNGGLTANSSSTLFRFAIASEIGGSSASAPSDYITLRRLYFGGVAELPVEVVSR